MTEQTSKNDVALAIIDKYILGALGVGLVPFPVIDMTVLMALQLKMLHSLAAVYETQFKDELGKEIISACLASVVPMSLTLNVSHLLRFIPVYGWLLKGMSGSLFAGLFTYTIGKLFIQHFESGNTFLTLDPQQVKDHFSTQFKQAQAEVSKSFVGIKP